MQRPKKNKDPEIGVGISTGISSFRTNEELEKETPIQKPAGQIPKEDRESVDLWQTRSGHGKKFERQARENLPAMPKWLKDRAMHRLSGMTQVRRGESGEREFLLHRGMGPKESKMAGDQSITHKEHSSWTANPKTAQNFAKRYSTSFRKGKTVSAWVPESEIHTMPLMYGSPSGRGQNFMREEQEVVVKPGTRQLHDNKMQKSEAIAGGLAAGKKYTDFNLKELARGTLVELEHTPNMSMAQEIAMDHLVEDDRYYQKLKTIESEHHDALKKVASIAVINGNKVLMGKRRDTGKYTTPGGHLEKNETAPQAAKRELYEEAGIDTDNLTYIGNDYVCGHGNKKIMVFMFICCDKGLEPHNQNDPDNEVIGWEWHDVSDGLDKSMKLHSPKNVLLRKLGIMDFEKDKL